MCRGQLPASYDREAALLSLVLGFWSLAILEEGLEAGCILVVSLSSWEGGLEEAGTEP